MSRAAMTDYLSERPIAIRAELQDIRSRLRRNHCARRSTESLLTRATELALETRMLMSVWMRMLDQSDMLSRASAKGVSMPVCRIRAGRFSVS